MKKRQKGFSLVELIIVVAIMAILIGVLAPQYLKYVEKSKRSKDEQLADSIYKLASAMVADEDYNAGIANGDWITVDSQNGIDSNNQITIKGKALPEYISGWPQARFKSKEYKDKVYVITFGLTPSNVTQAFSEGWFNVGDPNIPQ